MPETKPNTSLVPQMETSIRGQAGQALIVQAHALTIERQPMVDFGTLLQTQSRLVPVQEGINKVLLSSKTNATLYLDDLQPAMINTIGRADRYFNIQLGLTSLIKSKAEKSVIIRSLQAAEDKALGFKSEADDVARRLDVLRKTLSDNGAEFQRQKQTLLVITEASDGVMKDLDRQMADIDGKMGGLIAGAVISGLAVIGGVILIAVGSIAGFVTAGTSVPLAVLGGTILVGGIAGTVGTGLGMGALAKQRADLLMQKTGLAEEVKFARTLQSTLTTLTDSAGTAAQAAQDMSNTWTMMSGHLNNLADDLSTGRIEYDDLLELFVIAAEGDVKDVKNDIRLIQHQLAGTSTIAPPKALLTEAIAIAANSNDNAARAA